MQSSISEGSSVIAEHDASLYEELQPFLRVDTYLAVRSANRGLEITFVTQDQSQFACRRDVLLQALQGPALIRC